MGISVYMQTLVLLYSVAVGAIVGVVFDVFRLLRLAFGVNKVTQFIYDILFSLIATGIYVLFLFYADDGTVRWYTTAGAAAGFYLYYQTIGRLVMLAGGLIISFIKAVLSFIWSITVGPLIKLTAWLQKLMGVGLLKILRFIKKIVGYFKYLHNRYKMQWKAARCFGLDQ